MKLVKQNSVLLILFFFLFISLSSFGSEKRDSLYVVEIDGNVLVAPSDTITSYKIELFCYNTVVDSIIVVDNETFLLKIKKNSRYTIRITKEGYSPISIAVNTLLPVTNTNSYIFHFDAELTPNNAIISKNDTQDFRTATISFNKRTKAFAYSEMR